MKILRINVNTKVNISNINLAIGNFDGIHIGHHEIIKKLVKESQALKVESAILCFDPHPRQYFENNYDDFNIINEETKIKLFSDYNVDHYISLEFDSSVATLTAEEFVENILIKKLNVSNLTIGYDFKFGKDRKGNIDLLRKLSEKNNFNISIIDKVINPINSEIYSSSLIRAYIKKGKFEKVSLLLGRNWIMRGKVKHGDHRASKMNFPTANIVPDNNIKPKKGVYAVKTRLMSKYYNGIANFGIRPTVDGKKLLLEVLLFDFKENIYGKELTVEFLTFIREEKKFENFDKLSKQISKDIQVAKSYHLQK